MEQIRGTPAPLDDEPLSTKAPGVRRRLFVVLAWAGGGFAAIAGLSLVLAPLSAHLLGEAGEVAFGLCIGTAVGGVIAIGRTAQQLDERHARPARGLFAVTVLGYAILINVFANVFATALNIGGQPDLGPAFSEMGTLVVSAAGAGAIGIFGLAITIGFESRLQRCARWGVCTAVVLIPVYTVDPALWWAGLLGGLVLAVAVEATVKEALKRWHVPESAMAACLIAGVSAAIVLCFIVAVFAGVADGTARS